MRRNVARFGLPLFEHDNIRAMVGSKYGNGVHTVIYGDHPLDLVYLDRGHDLTIVTFHAALSSRTKSLPVFSGLPITEGMNANVICVSDPSLAHLPIELGWHIGNDSQPLQRDLPRILESMLEQQSARASIFMGASGGGFAALYYSRDVAGSLALPLNPQTDLARYTRRPVENYLKHAFGVESRANLPTWATTNVLPGYYKSHLNTVAYVQNIGDSHHTQNHLRPALAAMRNDPAFAVMLPDWGRGHVLGSSEKLREILSRLTEARGDWMTTLARLGFRRGVTDVEVDRARDLHIALERGTASPHP